MNDILELFADKHVLSEAASARLVNLSLPQFRRLRYTGCGPRHVQLSERRLGYRIGDLGSDAEQTLQL